MTSQAQARYRVQPKIITVQTKQSITNAEKIQGQNKNNAKAIPTFFALSQNAFLSLVLKVGQDSSIATFLTSGLKPTLFK